MPWRIKYVCMCGENMGPVYDSWHDHDMLAEMTWASDTHAEMKEQARGPRWRRKEKSMNGKEICALGLLEEVWRRRRGRRGRQH